jgi:hypothetical protein
MSFHWTNFNFSQEQIRDLVLAWWFKDETNTFTLEAMRHDISRPSVLASSNIDGPNPRLIARALTA